MNKQELEQFFKDPRKFAVPGVIAAMVIAVWFLSYRAAEKKTIYRNEVQAKEAELEMKKGNIIDIPSGRKIEGLRKKYERYDKILAESLFYFKSKQKDYSPLRPLQFKEELLKIQQQMESSPGFEFPRGFGFTQYLEQDVPRDQDLADLTKELYVTHEVMKTFFKNNIDKVTEVKRLSPEVEFSRESSDKRRLMRIFSARFVLESGFLSLMQALYDISQSENYFLAVDRLDLEKISKDKVRATFIVRNVEFL